MQMSGFRIDVEMEIPRVSRLERHQPHQPEIGGTGSTTNVKRYRQGISLKPLLMVMVQKALIGATSMSRCGAKRSRRPVDVNHSGEEEGEE